MLVKQLIPKLSQFSVSSIQFPLRRQVCSSTVGQYLYKGAKTGRRRMPTYCHTVNAPAAIGPYSQATEHAGIIYTSGQIG